MGTITRPDEAMIEAFQKDWDAYVEEYENRPENYRH